MPLGVKTAVSLRVGLRQKKRAAIATRFGIEFLIV